MLNERDLVEVLLPIGAFVGTCYGAAYLTSEVFVEDWQKQRIEQCADVLPEEQTFTTDPIPEECSRYNFQSFDTIVRGELVVSEVSLPSSTEFRNNTKPTNNHLVAIPLSGAFAVVGMLVLRLGD